MITMQRAWRLAFAGASLLVALGASFTGAWYERSVTAVVDLVLSLPWLFVLLALRALLPLNTAPAISILATFA